jgi:hypothetical protein
MTHNEYRKIPAGCFLLAVIIFVQIFYSCAVSSQIPELPHGRTSSGEYSVHVIGPGIEILSGHNTENIYWAAVRAVNAELAVSSVSGEVISRHAGIWFSKPDLAAVLTASPHTPVRFRSGRPQNISGFYRIDGKTVSEPDGIHDALGIDSDGTPVILSPGEQSGWQGDAAGGFYTILLGGEPLNPVPLRDAVSAAGWSENGTTIILLAISGKNGKGYSYKEAGLLLYSLGAVYGIAMDGGGSSRLVWRAEGTLHSFPSALFYRALPNHLLLLK